MTLEATFGTGNYVLSLCGKYIRQDNLIPIHLVSTSVILIAFSLILPEFYLSFIDNYIIQFCPRGLKCFTRVFCSWMSSNFERILFCFVQFGANCRLCIAVFGAKTLFRVFWALEIYLITFMFLILIILSNNTLLELIYYVALYLSD